MRCSDRIISQPDGEVYREKVAEGMKEELIS